MADQLADQNRETQRWQEIASQKLAEVEKIATQQREVEQTTAANHQQETDQLRQQIAELTAQQAKLQAAHELDAAMADQLADQKCETQHWQEMAQQKLDEVERLSARQREVEQTTAATHQQETDQLRQQIAELQAARAGCGDGRPTRRSEVRNPALAGDGSAEAG